MRGGTVIRSIRIQTTLGASVRDGQFVERSIAGAPQCAVRTQRNGKSSHSDKYGKMLYDEFFFVKQTLGYPGRKGFGFVFHGQFVLAELR